LLLDVDVGRMTMEKLISHYLAPHRDIEAQDFIKNFLCSTCYGHLIGHLTDEGALVLCAKCHLETKGYVSKRRSTGKTSSIIAGMVFS
jgi:hypothetical protein